MSETAEQFDCLWPGGARAVEAVPLAPRSDLSGKRIALVWDHVFRGDEIFPMLERTLSDQFENVTFFGYDHFGSTFGGDEHQVLADLPNRLKELEVDAVISGIGC